MFLPTASVRGSLARAKFTAENNQVMEYVMNGYVQNLQGISIFFIKFQPGVLEMKNVRTKLVEFHGAKTMSHTHCQSVLQLPGLWRTVKQSNQVPQ